MIIIVDNNSGNLSSFKKMCKKLKVKNKIVKSSILLNNLKSSKVTGIILSGGGLQLDKKIKLEEIRADLEMILSFNVPVLGICLGYEILAEISGAEIAKLKKPIRNKMNQVEINNKIELFESLPKKIEVYENHSRYIKNLPTKFKIIASSNKNKIEGFKHDKKPWYGLQFHPEESGLVGQRILENFFNLCKN